ncbi:hypothetical protein NYF23_02615 [SAR92 clade bacterium H455]|uniref:Uncharacterized protein n=1 Tax=SAR92 clade bacterium H455 TaxID=2974818 RepID=A0ABY5TNU5_9GAMM|nr:hypothetical protein NYF23_02615 [SAR92 clade bacterium H455]
MNPTNQQPNKPMPPIAIALVACGGGVVGYDYATWMEVSPLVGAIIGLIISAIMVNVLNHIMRDPDRKIREGCIALGGVAGAMFGLTVATDNNAEGWGFFITTAIFGGIGAGLGSMAASLLSYAAFLLLLISQGPIGFAIRSIVLNSN